MALVVYLWFHKDLQVDVSFVLHSTSHLLCVEDNPTFTPDAHIFQVLWRRRTQGHVILHPPQRGVGHMEDHYRRLTDSFPCNRFMR